MGLGLRGLLASGMGIEDEDDDYEDEHDDERDEDDRVTDKMTKPSHGLIVGGMQSSAGKTAVTCMILAALYERGLPIQSFKAGPDFIELPRISRPICRRTVAQSGFLANARRRHRSGNDDTRRRQNLDCGGRHGSV